MRNRLDARRRRHVRVRKAVIGTTQRPAPGGLPEQPLSVCPGDRRPDRPHPGRGVVAGSAAPVEDPHRGDRHRDRKARRRTRQGGRRRSRRF